MNNFKEAKFTLKVIQYIELVVFCIAKKTKRKNNEAI